MVKIVKGKRHLDREYYPRIVFLTEDNEEGLFWVSEPQGTVGVGETEDGCMEMIVKHIYSGAKELWVFRVNL